MDIAALSMSLSMSRLSVDWSMALMAKTMDVAEESSEALAQMMESLASPELGQIIDIRV